jgi:hypothetical protein
MPPLPPSVLLPSDRQNQEQPPVSYAAFLHGQPSAQTNRGVAQTQSIPTRPGPKQSSRPQVQIQETHPQQHQQGQLPSPMQTDIPSPHFQSIGNVESEQPDRRYSGAVAANLQTDARAHPAPGPATASPRKRQRIQPAAMPSLKGRIKLIEQHIQRSGGHITLTPSLERPRFQLLTDACNQEDAFYVALHQIFCCWDIDRNQVLNIAGYPKQQDLQFAFKILGQLIRDNLTLAPTHKDWFANFPSPLRDLLQSSEPYRRTVGEVGTFLGRLALCWGTFSNECSKRGYPPLVDELVQNLGLLSPILQGVVFTASRRNLGIRDEEVGTRMEDLFIRDQKEHQALAARYNTARPPTSREAMDRNRVLAQAYVNLHNQLISQRSRSAMMSTSSTPTPVLPSNEFNQSRVSNLPLVPRPQQMINQGNWAQSGQIPTTSGMQQYPASLPSRMQRATDGVSNPATAGSRPPSVGSQRMYADTPSPILFQGLSMQSPVQQNFPSPVTRNDAQMQNNHAGAQPNETYYQSPLLQQVDPAVQQRMQLAVNHQQQQQMVTQFHQQQNNQQWAQNNLLYQQQQQLASQQQQQQNMQQDLSRQIFNQNHSAQPRRGSNPILNQQQRISSRNNSVVSNGHDRPESTPMAGSHELPPVAVADIIAYNQKHVLQRSLIPPLHYVHPQQAQNPDVTALHQAHIRSPRLVAADDLPSGMSQDNPASRYYQAIRGFVLSPTRISSTSPLSRFDFIIPPFDLALVAKDTAHASGQVSTREFRQGTLQYRLRCIQAKKTETRYTMPDWVVADTVWPESASIAINRNQLEIRRKNHHGKDLPVDITHFIRLSTPGSTNQITLSILKSRTKMKEFNYFLAVEVIEILHHSQILKMCYNNHISESITLNKIKKSLASPSGDDDDVAMVVSDLSIDLADPFTSKVFKTPVRGNSCLHRECFDLEVYLLTRNSKPKRPEQPCMVDVWKCPLCGKDARPYSLQIDDFLASVRAALERQGKLEEGVKAILISADGNWRPKIEPRKSTAGEDSDYSSDGDGAIMRAASTASKQPVLKKPVEVISLDD